MAARWEPVRAAALTSAIQCNAVCRTTSILRVENVFISGRWPSWDAVSNFPKGKISALYLER